MLDLRLNYMVADREPITENEIRAQIIRIFTACFVEEETGREEEIITLLLSVLLHLREAAADRDNEDDVPAAVETLRGTDAEEYYVQAAREAYIAEGMGEHYANESASWPEILPMNADWDTDILTELAQLEVGHELVSMDYTRALIQREQLHGSVQ
jgi:hypothetical protein